MFLTNKYANAGKSTSLSAVAVYQNGKSLNNNDRDPASFPVVLGDFGCDVSVKLVGKIRTRFQAFSGNSDSANWPGYEADRDQDYEPRETEHPTQTLVFTKNL